MQIRSGPALLNTELDTKLTSDSKVTCTWKPSPLGHKYLNDLIPRSLPEPPNYQKKVFIHGIAETATVNTSSEDKI